MKMQWLYARAMLGTLKACARVMLTPMHLQRTLLIAFSVGSLLNVLNLGGDLLRGVWTSDLAVKVTLNYLIPFAVSNVGLLARQRH